MATHDISPSASDWRITSELRRQLLAALASDPDCVMPLTYDEFLRWADEDTHAEWVDGEVIMPSPANARHQDIARLLTALLSDFVEFTGQGKIYPAPFQMKLEHSGREPDLLFVSAEHLDRIKPTLLEGPADLVIEIVSPESRGRDRGDKFYEYQAAGIPEYWLLDPETERAEFYQLDDHGAYHFREIAPMDTYYSKALRGFWLRPEWLWQQPLPPKDRLLIEIGGQDYKQYMLRQLEHGQQ